MSIIYFYPKISMDFDSTDIILHRDDREFSAMSHNVGEVS